MQDRPTAIELLQAAQAFCERDLIPNLEGRVGFHARVLRNVLAIIERELDGEEAALLDEWERLGTLLDRDADAPSSFAQLRDDVRAMNVDLARAIRDGAFDDRFDEVHAALRATVRNKLAIANPSYDSSEA